MNHIQNQLNRKTQRTIVQVTLNKRPVSQTNLLDKQQQNKRKKDKANSSSTSRQKNNYNTKQYKKQDNKNINSQLNYISLLNIKPLNQSKDYNNCKDIDNQYKQNNSQRINEQKEDNINFYKIMKDSNQIIQKQKILYENKTIKKINKQNYHPQILSSHLNSSIQHYHSNLINNINNNKTNYVNNNNKTNYVNTANPIKDYKQTQTNNQVQKEYEQNINKIPYLINQSSIKQQTKFINKIRQNKRSSLNQIQNINQVRNKVKGIVKSFIRQNKQSLKNTNKQSLKNINNTNKLQKQSINSFQRYSQSYIIQPIIQLNKNIINEFKEQQNYHLNKQLTTHNNQTLLDLLHQQQAIPANNDSQNNNNQYKSEILLNRIIQQKLLQNSLLKQHIISLSTRLNQCQKQIHFIQQQYNISKVIQLQSKIQQILLLKQQQKQQQQRKQRQQRNQQQQYRKQRQQHRKQEQFKQHQKQINIYIQKIKKLQNQLQSVKHTNQIQLKSKYNLSIQLPVSISISLNNKKQSIEQNNKRLNINLQQNDKSLITLQQDHMEKTQKQISQTDNFQLISLQRARTCLQNKRPSMPISNIIALQNDRRQSIPILQTKSMSWMQMRGQQEIDNLVYQIDLLKKKYQTLSNIVVSKKKQIMNKDCIIKTLLMKQQRHEFQNRNNDKQKQIIEATLIFMEQQIRKFYI